MTFFWSSLYWSFAWILCSVLSRLTWLLFICNQFRSICLGFLLSISLSMSPYLLNVSSLYTSSYLLYLSIRFLSFSLPHLLCISLFWLFSLESSSKQQHLLDFCSLLKHEARRRRRKTFQKRLLSTKNVLVKKNAVIILYFLRVGSSLQQLLSPHISLD